MNNQMDFAIKSASNLMISGKTFPEAYRFVKNMFPELHRNITVIMERAVDQYRKGGNCEYRR